MIDLEAPPIELSDVVDIERQNQMMRDAYDQQTAHRIAFLEAKVDMLIKLVVPGDEG